jgi:hypothetical protein
MWRRIKVTVKLMKEFVTVWKWCMEDLAKPKIEVETTVRSVALSEEAQNKTLAELNMIFNEMGGKNDTIN